MTFRGDDKYLYSEANWFHLGTLKRYPEQVAPPLALAGDLVQIDMVVRDFRQWWNNAWATERVEGQPSWFKITDVALERGKWQGGFGERHPLEWAWCYTGWLRTVPVGRRSVWAVYSRVLRRPKVPRPVSMRVRLYHTLRRMWPSDLLTQWELPDELGKAFSVMGVAPDTRQSMLLCWKRLTEEQQIALNEIAFIRDGGGRQPQT